MKNRIMAFCALAQVLLVMSCTHDVLPATDDCLEFSSSSNVVSYNDIATYVKVFHGATLNSANTKSYSEMEITPFVVDDSDVLLYKIKYKDGFEIISTDKRLSPVVMSGSGDLKISDLNEISRSLLDDYCEQIKQLRNIVLDEENENTEFWTMLKPETVQTKSMPIGGDPGQIPDSMIGWRLIGSQSMSRDTVEIPHIAITQWGQGSPWNQYCPKVNNIPDEFWRRCMVGCVPLAFSQILYWAHYNLGAPVYADTMGACNSVWNPSNARYTDFSSSGPDSTAWDAMSTVLNNGNNSYVSILLAKVGKDIGAIYGQYETGYDTDSLFSNTKDIIKQNYGITYDRYSNYNQATRDTIIANLLRRIPSFLSVTSLSGAHALVVDGIRIVTVTTRMYYIYDPHNTYDPKDYLDDSEQWFDAGSSGAVIIPSGYQSRSVDMITKFNSYYLRWGFSGDGDDLLYNADGIWRSPIDDNVSYNATGKVFTNFRKVEGR